MFTYREYVLTSTRGLLAVVPLFAGLDAADLARIDDLVTEVTVPAGRVLMSEGDVGRESFVVADGWARVSVAGREVGRVGPGGMLGEMALLDRRHARTATVTASSTMTLLVLDPGAFDRLLLEHPRVTRQVAATLAARLREQQRPA
jgi:CRP-like cAMP-binding protein